MGLFTNPITINDGSADHVFSFRGQVFDKRQKSSIGEWVEPAASSIENSIIRIKHDASTDIWRHLCQRSVMQVPAADPDGIYRMITMNLTYTAHKYFTYAEIDPQLYIIKNALSKVDFTKNMRNLLL